MVDIKNRMQELVLVVIFVTSNLTSHLTFYKGNSNSLLYARTTSTNADSVAASNTIWQAGTFIKLQMSYTV